MTPAIETIGLGKRYGRTWALQDCSVQIPQGRVSALVGPNGAGKTTLLRQSVILSSHLLHDLERVCDHVILLASSRTQICDDIDNVLASHKMRLGPRRAVPETARGFDVIKATHTANQTRLLVRLDGPIIDPAWEMSEVALEEIVLAYMGMDESVSAGTLRSVRTAS